MEEKTLKITGKSIQISDGYHTFDELYEHRIVLFIALCSCYQVSNYYKEGKATDKEICWRSKLHSDGTMFDGWFILGINQEKGKQITYHLPIEKWDKTGFARTLKNAPEWDGHTPQMVLDRISNLREEG